MLVFRHPGDRPILQGNAEQELPAKANDEEQQDEIRLVAAPVLNGPRNARAQRMAMAVMLAHAGLAQMAETVSYTEHASSRDECRYEQI